jgi:hypothetical protein
MILTVYNTEIYVITLGIVVNQVLSGTQVQLEVWILLLACQKLREMFQVMRMLIIDN